MVPASGILQSALLALVVAVVFVNGWTDAPNAIASAVGTGALRYRDAVWLAAACNLAGVAGMSLISTSVADVVTGMARFDAGDPVQSLAALCAAMASIVIFAVTAWFFGIPTSESHALVAALTGAAVSLGGFSEIDLAAWRKVLWGLGLSLGMGLALGWAFTVLLRPKLARCSGKTLKRLQILSAGGMAFMHGAQDGQKFIAVLVSVDLLSKGLYAGQAVDIRLHFPAMFLCAATMALGTSVGGGRIVKTLGEKMVSGLRPEQGVCADLAGALCLFGASVSGVPMSTTHTKTTAIFGAGLAQGRENVSFAVIRDMLAAWLITFPACGLLGFFLTKAILRLVS